LNRKEPRDALLTAAGKIIDWPVFTPLRVVAGLFFRWLFPRIAAFYTKDVFNCRFRFFARGSLLEPVRYNPFFSDWDLGLELESMDGVDFPKLRQKLNELRKYFPPFVEIEIYTEAELAWLNAKLAQTVDESKRSINDYHQIFKWARKIRWLIERQHWRSAPAKYRRAAKIAVSKLRTWYPHLQLKGDPLTPSSVGFLSQVLAEIFEELDSLGPSWSQEEAISIFGIQQSAKLRLGYFNFDVGMIGYESTDPYIVRVSVQNFVRMLFLFTHKKHVTEKFSRVNFSGIRGRSVVAALHEIEILTLTSYTRSLEEPGLQIEQWIAELRDDLNSQIAGMKEAHPIVGPSVAGLIGTLVKNGKSFLEVGGLWDLEKEMCTAAALGGARSISQFDILPESHENWGMLRFKLKALGYPKSNLVSGDFIDSDCAPVDVVYSAYVLHHIFEVHKFLRKLNDSSLELVVLVALIVPQYARCYQSDSWICVPKLSEIDRADLCEIYGFEGAIGLDLPPPSDLTLDDRSYFWWLPSHKLLLEVCKNSGLEIIEDWPAMNGKARTLLMRSRAQPL